MSRLYSSSDGRFYTDWEVARRMESGVWAPCMWDPDSGWELVEGESGLVWLVPVEPSAAPDWVEVRQSREGPGEEVVDTRR